MATFPHTCITALLLAGLGVSSAAAPVKARATVTLLNAATVRGAVVRLPDVARVRATGPVAARLNALEMGGAPLPGQWRTVSAEFVRMRLRQDGLDPALVAPASAPRCKVARASQTVSAERLIEAAREAIGGTATNGEARVVIAPVSRPRDMVLPAGALALAAEAGPATGGAVRRVTVRATVDGTDCGRADVFVREARYVRVAVAAAAIARGQAIIPEAVRYEERDRAGLPADALLEGQPLDNVQATQGIPAGAPLTARLAAEPPVIKRGDVVTLRAQTGGIVVSGSGVAVEDGRPGQWIRVRNAASQKESRARVVDEKTVDAAL